MPFQIKLQARGGLRVGCSPTSHVLCDPVCALVDNGLLTATTVVAMRPGQADKAGYENESRAHSVNGC